MEDTDDSEDYQVPELNPKRRVTIASIDEEDSNPFTSPVETNPTKDAKDSNEKDSNSDIPIFLSGPPILNRRRSSLKSTQLKATGFQRESSIEKRSLAPIFGSSEIVAPKISFFDSNTSKKEDVDSDDGSDGYKPPSKLFQRKASFVSSIDADGVASSINEDYKVKLGYLWYGGIALVMIMIEIWFFVTLRGDGLKIDFGGSFLRSAAAILMEAFMSVSHYCVEEAIESALAVYFGMKLASPQGCSLAVCGFLQSSAIGRVSFSSKLYIKSKVKGFLSLLGILYSLHSTLHICTLSASIYLQIDDFYLDQGTRLCNEYHQNGTQYDRKWPTVEVTMGVASNTFGTSLGNLRADQPKLKKSMVAISPQLTDQSVDSTMIFGRGYSASISSDCTCLHSVTLEELVHAEMTLGDAQKAIEIYNSWDRGSGIVNEVSQSNNSVRIRSILMGTNVCGGYNNTHPPAPFCTTYIDDFSNALVSVSFMKNTIAPATSFAKIVQVREKRGLANIDWLYNGLVLLNEGTLNGFRLATGYPNSINPLLKWTTTSKQNVNAAKVEEGLEALFAAMSRAAVQRSFLTKGSSCSTTVVDQDRLVLRIGYIGLAFGVIYIVVELLYLSVVAYVFAQWFLSEYPVLPAIRFVHEKQYFTVMLSQLMQLPFISEINATLEQVHYWPKLDIFMRIGESINTVDDHDFGVISIDKPKKITHLSWTKEYQ